MSKGADLQFIGWREIVHLPELGLNAIPAKIDTGARTSSLHALEVEKFERNGEAYVRFLVECPGGGEPQRCEAVNVDIRGITSSNGETQRRYVIKTKLKIGMIDFRAEITLADRSDMKFPMLIGRSSLRRRFVVDSGHSWLQSPGRNPVKGHKP
ncbi:ATP-dependent zinc protease [Altererythrobacter sp. GH1-8]|uniref:ATP-dependent zinc protease family protein n=1 Tax=Altererythrobacter sp. GH1-8 TaxID=3349333 RepID=UPI00374CB3C2